VLDVTPTALASPPSRSRRIWTGALLADALNDESCGASLARGRGPRRGQGPGGQKPAPSGPVASEADEEIRQRLISLGYLRRRANNAHNNRGIMPARVRTTRRSPSSRPRCATTPLRGRLMNMPRVLGEGRQPHGGREPPQAGAINPR